MEYGQEQPMGVIYALWTQILCKLLQQGTAFFASTSLFALGGCFALLGAADKVATVLADVAFITETSRASFGNQNVRAFIDLRICVFQIWLGVSTV